MADGEDVFNIERIVGWLMSAVLLGAVVWSVTGFVDGPGEPRPGPRAETTAFAMDSLVAESLAQDVVTDGPSRAPASPGAVAGPNTLGDDASLDELWRDCESGDGVACDRLFEVSPVGSEYERFGLSCGERPLVLNCAEMP